MVSHRACGSRNVHGMSGTDRAPMTVPRTKARKHFVAGLPTDVGEFSTFHRQGNGGVRALCTLRHRAVCSCLEKQVRWTGETHVWESQTGQAAFELPPTQKQSGSTKFDLSQRSLGNLTFKPLARVWKCKLSDSSASFTAEDSSHLSLLLV
jgi:hypothetical protein